MGVGPPKPAPIPRPQPQKEMPTYAQARAMAAPTGPPQMNTSDGFVPRSRIIQSTGFHAEPTPQVLQEQ